MTRHIPSLLALTTAALLALSGPAGSALSAKVNPVIQPAVDGVMKAFETHSVVAIGDNHGNAQENAFYVALISDPRFAKQVGNVVVETASAFHQDILDRYVAGESVPYPELRKVWMDVVGSIPGVTGVSQVNFFAAARAANLKLPPDQRIHVWAGEPPADWSKIYNRAEFQALHLDREQYPADLVRGEILAKGKKILIIYGAAHWGLGNTLNAKIEAGQPQKVFIIEPLLGYDDPTCDKAVEARASQWPKPWAVVSPVRDTWVADLLTKPGCTVTMAIAGPGAPPQVLANVKQVNVYGTGAQADAILYLGPIASQLRDQTNPSYYLDQDYFNEIARRYQIMMGQPLDWASAVAGNGQGVLPMKAPRKPTAELQAALRKHLLSVQAGKADYDSFTPALAENVRAQWTDIVARTKAYGALKRVTFSGSDPRGGGIFEADFENAKSIWTIVLDQGGKISGMNRPGPTRRPVNRAAGRRTPVH